MTNETCKAFFATGCRCLLYLQVTLTELEKVSKLIVEIYPFLGQVMLKLSC